MRPAASIFALALSLTLAAGCALEDGTEAGQGGGTSGGGAVTSSGGGSGGTSSGGADVDAIPTGDFTVKLSPSSKADVSIGALCSDGTTKSGEACPAGLEALTVEHFPKIPGAGKSGNYLNLHVRDQVVVHEVGTTWPGKAYDSGLEGHGKVLNDGEFGVAYEVRVGSRKARLQASSDDPSDGTKGAVSISVSGL